MGIFAITGAASGIGKAIAHRLKGDGHDTIEVDLSGGDVVADLRKEQGRRKAIVGVKEAAPRGLDGLVLAAGLGPHVVPVSDIVRVNYFAVFALIEGLHDLVMQRRGSIVLVSSNSAQMGYDQEFVASLTPGNEEAVCVLAEQVDGQTAYGGSKLALTRWMRGASATLAGQGIRINAIAPGYTETAMTEEGLKHPDFGPLMADFRETIPIGRPGVPEDQAAAACFLLSKEARYITGTVLFVDGGHDAMFRPDDF